MENVPDIKGYALVTGGTSGIGLAIALELAKRGYDLLLVSNQLDLLQRFGTEIPARFPVKCETMFADLSKQDAAQLVLEFCRSRGIEIEVLVNNAGMLIFSEVTDTPQEKIQAILNLHMHTPVFLCRLFGEQMRSAKRGYILNISSISSVMPFPGISLYGPTKTFLRYFTRALRYEMKPHHIEICCVLPGATETGLYDPNKVNLGQAKRLGIMQKPEFVAHQAVQALFSGRAECTPGFLNKLTIWFMPVIPRFIIQYLFRNTSLMQQGRSVLDG